MEEILNRLESGARVLDLASASGSFDPRFYPFQTIRLDRDPHAGVAPLVRATAAQLPFIDNSFDAIVSNHGFEHFYDVDAALRELRRVVKPHGALFVSVPNAATMCDRLYRWLHPGDHVQQFTDPAALAARIAEATGFAHRATRVLYTSYSFLNAYNRKLRAPRRLWLLANGDERALRALNSFSNRQYGWAFWFGNVDGIDETPRINVCIRCGSGVDAAGLRPARGWFQCPRCQAPNRFYSMA